MSEGLISKKELLDLTGISYGQLYRWKRKNLIPEDWFIRKSSFTGQETFFPRDRILPRIDKILNMKEGLSLDELADMFSPSLGEVQLSADQLKERNIVSNITLDLYEQSASAKEKYEWEQILAMYVLEKLLHDGAITREEGIMLVGVMNDYYSRFAGNACELVLIRKMGVPVLMLMSQADEVFFDRGVKVVFKLGMQQCTEELKLKIGDWEES
ncbi:DUF4004 domain-containing protein [Paenibacillus sp. CAA11]|uniref:YhbD family protein n=1 Tax=Paenibacillus sp. CAA11 TaxID=1532905 RepID=UPI000D336629|nr:YhbD family protein [Paenibacillus sp. CAA11]AWB46205.1 DUF4004 domain-containing protein [Paenibacillus sp. CAA11]